MKKLTALLLTMALLLSLLPVGITEVRAAGTTVSYAVEGGNIYFDTSTGTVTDCDPDVTVANIPHNIEGVPVTAIGDSAFYDCDNLTSITIPDSVTSIGDSAFYCCYYLTSITIPDGVTSIGNRVFDYCNSLSGIWVQEGNEVFSSDTNGVLFSKDKTQLLQFPGGYYGAYTIPDSVTTIGEYAFSNRDNLTSITIPDSVTSIGDSAFYSCYDLTSITIGDGVTTIGNSAFSGCNSLSGIWVQEGNEVFSSDTNGVLFCKDKTQLLQFPGGYYGAYTIPDGVATIGNSAFSYCSNLTSITIPDSVTTIGDSAFYNCNDLTSITIPDGVTTIGDSAFSYCGDMTSITIGDGVTTIGDSAFLGCKSLTSITIPDGVTTIGDSAFVLCDAMTSITIPDSVTTIGDSAFYNCNDLTSITIPDSVTTIGNSAFSHCNSLSGIWVQEGNEVYCSDTNGVLFNKDKTKLLQCPGGYYGAYTIPDGVTTIGDYAFYDCEALTSITIPDSVTTIGDSTFYGCKALTSITIGYGVTTIGDSAFYDCDAMTSITIPDSVTTIGDCAFSDCYKLTSITIPNGVTTIGDYAFSYCYNLTSIIIPDSVTTIGDSAFKCCYDLASITIGDGVTTIGDSAFFSCYNLTSITIPDSVTTIGDSAFYNCNDLTSITIGDGVTTIGDSAFFSCNSLTSITIPDSVTTIGDSAFYYCEALTSITIPDSVTTIGDYAFSYCYNLTSIIIPDSVTTIGDYAFKCCYDLASITIPDSVTTISDYAFYDCDALESIIIPDSVTTIDFYAFDGCYRLTDVYYYGTETQWKNITIMAGNKALQNATIHYESPHNHVWDAGKITTAATCVDAGVKTYTCTDCGATKEETIPATDHSYEITYSVEADCNWTGVIRYTCSNCGDAKTEILPALGHSFDSGAVTTPASCTEAGVFTYTCERCKEIKTEPIPATEHSYEITYTVEAECNWTGVIRYACSSCGDVKTETLPALGHSFDSGTVTTPATCTEEGVLTYACERCKETKTEPIPATGHLYIRYSNNGPNHSVMCAYCRNIYTEAHNFTAGDCICGAAEPAVDGSIQISHTLNLASDIAISYVIVADSLSGYDSYYMECVTPVYEGNTLVGSTTHILEPELRGSYYYFILDGLTSLEMNDTVEARLYMTKAGKSYTSEPDHYSVATYAYNKLNNSTTAQDLKTVCANLLQYGSKAQLYKEYRTDALPDGEMTAEHRSYLTDPTSVAFGNNKSFLGDHSAPTVTFVGAPLRLDSKIIVRYVIDTTAYKGNMEDLSLRISYEGIDGSIVTETLRDLELYYEAASYYAFDFDGLLASELRTVMSAVVYEGDTPVSETMTYSVDTYGNGRTGSLLTLIQAMMAYSDSCKVYFE